MSRIKKIPLPIIQEFREDPRVFFKFLKVFDKESAQLVPFELREEQEELLDALQTGQNIVVLKSRQIGCSTLIRAYFLWKAYISEEPIQHAIISYTRDSADHLHSIDKGFYLGLPKSLQRKLSKSSARTLEFSDTGSTLRSFTASGKAGATRSFTFTSTHISEFAFFDDADDLLANVLSSVGGGQIVIETTPNKPGDKFHELIMGSPGNGWKLCFFPWYHHKNYAKKSQFHQPQVPDMTDDEKAIMEEFGLTKAQMYWRRTQINTMGIEKFRREFPATIDEAFFTNSLAYFPLDILDTCEVVDLGGHHHRHYSQIVQGDKYAMGVDVAHGVGSDYSTITVVSATTRQIMYHYRNNTITPAQFAEVVAETYYEWGEPFTIVESNGPGGTVLYRLEEFGVRNLFYDERGRPWKTVKHNKVAILDYMKECICDRIVCTVDKHLWQEMRGMEITKDAPANHDGHDDLIIATALALWSAKIRPAPSFASVRASLIEEYKKKKRTKQILRQGGHQGMIRTWSKK